MEYTKGEGTFREDEDTFQIYVPRGFTVAKIHKRWGDDGKANAQLIAAAPDLYEACQQVRDWLHPQTVSRIGRISHYGMDTFNKLEQALAKAEGK